MKIRHQVNLFILILLFVLSAVLVAAGYFAINRIVMQDSTTVFTRELDNIDFSIRQSYKELEDTQLLGLESYVNAEKKRLLEFLKGYRFGQTGQLHLIGPENQNMLNGATLGNTSYNKKIFQQMHNSGSGQIRFLANNQSYFSVFRHSSHWDWLMVLTIAEEELFASRNFYLKATFAFIIVTFLIVVLFSFRLGSVLLKRIDTTLSCLHQVEQGDLEARISSPGADEIGTIQTGINAMIDTVSTKTRELETTNAALQTEITERLSIEAALQTAREAAEASNQAKSIFLSHMSHELRTPLNAILGFSRIMEREPEANRQQKEKLKIIRQSGEFLLGLINDILDVSIIETGHMEFEETSFDLLMLIEYACSISQVRAHEKGLLFYFSTESVEQRYVNTDEKKLRQVLLNLLGNAIKFTEKGSVTCRVQSGVTDKADSACRIIIEVQDSGVGIAPEMQEKIFEPFAREEAVNRSSIKGTGLGLAISESFISLMGGNITVESEPGKGSLFRIEIPAKIAQPDDIVEKSIKSPRVTGLVPGQKDQLIMLVEDNPENRILLKSLLENAGFSVIEATNGKEAVEAFRTSQPDFIWMDMRMPVMDGFEATRQIREMPDGKNKPIVALTASVFKEQEQQIISAGCNDIVYKPIEEPQIFETMKKYLDVAYLYEEEESSKAEEKSAVLNREMLDSLAEEFRRELRQAALEGDGKRVRELAETIIKSQPETAKALRKAADEYQLDTILKMMEELQ